MIDMKPSAFAAALWLCAFITLTMVSFQVTYVAFMLEECAGSVPVGAIVAQIGLVTVLVGLFTYDVLTSN